MALLIRQIEPDSNVRATAIEQRERSLDSSIEDVDLELRPTAVVNAYMIFAPAVFDHSPTARGSYAMTSSPACRAF